MSNATAATAVMRSSHGIVTLALTSGERYTTPDGDNFVARLDRQIGDDGWKRSGYNFRNGAMTAELTRTQLLADHVASK